MKKFTVNLDNQLNTIPQFMKTISLLLGMIITYASREPIAVLIFHGKDFYGRNVFYQLFLLVFFSALFSLVCLVLFLLLKKIKAFSVIFERFDLQYSNFTNTLKIDAHSRIFIAMIIVGSGFAAIILFNNLLSNINTKVWEFGTPDYLPLISPIGVDFRNGIYNPTELLFSGRSISQILMNTINETGYPPLVTFIGLFFLPYNANTAYLVQVALLVLANIACLGLAVAIINKFLLSNLGIDKRSLTYISIFIFFASLILLISSYAFAFSIERGNYDIFALFFTLLTVWVLLNHPERIWTQVILLSIATNLKIYPAILFILLLKKHGKKIILPTIVSNLVLLLILGPNNLIAFVTSLFSALGIGNKYPWVGNHSSYSFAMTLIKNVYPGENNLFIPLWIILTLIPLLFWGVALIHLFRQKFSAHTAILFYMVSVPVMDLVPIVGNDYKLVILYSTSALLIGYILQRIIQKGSIFKYIELIFLSTIFLAIGRSYIFFSQDSFWILANKYIWSLSFEALIVWNIFKLKKTDLNISDTK